MWSTPSRGIYMMEAGEGSTIKRNIYEVGRGGEQSFCILMTGEKISKDSLKRMQTMVRTNDGFEISEVDLQLRGPGDLMGTQQSGLLDLKIADLAKDGSLVVIAREAAKELIKSDPTIEKKENKGVRSVLSEMLRSKPNWGRIA